MLDMSIVKISVETLDVSLLDIWAVGNAVERLLASVVTVSLLDIGVLADEVDVSLASPNSLEGSDASVELLDI